MLRFIHVLAVGHLFGTIADATFPCLPSAREIYRFPNDTFIENATVLKDGRLLLNTFDDARIYVIEPSSPKPEAQLLVKVPGVNRVTGIAQTGSNTFAVSAGIEGVPFQFVNGSALIATLDIGPGASGQSPILTVVAKIPNTVMLNGMTALPHFPHVVLSADSVDGRIFRIDTITGRVTVVFQNELLRPGYDAQKVPLGANGLEIHKGYLYFTNSDLQFFARIMIDPSGQRFGAIKRIYSLPTAQLNVFDDFSITRHGVAYICSNPDSLVKVTPGGQLKTIIGPNSDTKLLSPTSVVLAKDEKSAYVVTGGNGSGGQVIQVQCLNHA